MARQTEFAQRDFSEAWDHLNNAYMRLEAGSAERLQISGLMEMATGLQCLANAIKDVYDKLQKMDRGR